VGLREVGVIADKLYSISDGDYVGPTERIEHGGRMQRLLSEGEEIEFAAYSTRFENTRYGCAIVLTNQGLYLLPESRYRSPMQAAWGAVRGKGDAVYSPYSQIRQAESYSTAHGTGFFQGITQGRYTSDHLRILHSNGEKTQLESIMGKGRHNLAVRHFSRYI
jgi:hypothetical protein